MGRIHAPRRLAILASIAMVALLLAVPGVRAADTGVAQTYLVVFKAQALPSNAAASIKAAGGTVVNSYPQIGVVIAQSSSATFRSTVMRNGSIQGASATAAFATHVSDGVAGTQSDASSPVVNTPVSDTDSLSGLQWDMQQINTPGAHAITGGSPSIVVGDIDTGLDYTHPDLAANVDGADSVNCVSGVPVPGSVAAMDDNGHGTHTAGTIAAAANGIGIVGVAPNVKIAGIKAGNADGFFFPEAVVCAFMWAGTHHIPVTNNSYFADPYLFNCKNDPVQRAIWIAEQRAILFAESKGTVVVAAEGNEADDLAHPTQDVTSPDDSTPIVRTVRNSCAVVPVEVQGVVGVTADGNLLQKSFYSSYGIGKADVTAPGGDSILQLTSASPNGRVLSTWPASLLTVTCLPARRLVDVSGATYCYQQGTSMASPHVAGVAALIESVGVTARGAVAASLENTADPIACPTPDVLAGYAFFPSVSNGAPQACQGGIGNNSWYGKGQVNALSAIDG
ncbi:MAG TPA: S8 family serine peptidase [Actinomycetota bacterium]|nr:S8 family serine peptidase [Actinomycetota bacterium]